MMCGLACETRSTSVYASARHATDGTRHYNLPVFDSSCVPRSALLGDFSYCARGQFSNRFLRPSKEYDASPNFIVVLWRLPGDDRREKLILHSPLPVPSAGVYKMDRAFRLVCVELDCAPAAKTGRFSSPVLLPTLSFDSARVMVAAKRTGRRCLMIHWRVEQLFSADKTRGNNTRVSKWMSHNSCTSRV